jgi:acetyltransferase-like isoleucine patch superfamily enzyme
MAGVHIGQDVWIGCDAIIETSRAKICSSSSLMKERHVQTWSPSVTVRQFKSAPPSSRTFAEQEGVVIEEDATVGVGAIVLPNVTIGRGSIVTAGSVVTKSVPPKTMVQGNPARPIATVETALTMRISLKEFGKGLRTIRENRPQN